LEYLGVDGRIVLQCIKEIGWQDVDWMKLGQDRDLSRADVNMVVNLTVP